MKIYKIKNIWSYIDKVDAIAFTSNGFVKSNGCAVMGRGIALDTKNKFENVDKLLGNHIKKNGNIVGIIKQIGRRTDLVSFPVKRDEYDIELDKYDNFPGFARVDLEMKFKGHTVYPGWALKAEVDIIKYSGKDLMEIIEFKKWKSVLLTPPGIKNGGLSWKDEVEPELEQIFDERVKIVYKGE